MAESSAIFDETAEARRAPESTVHDDIRHDIVVIGASAGGIEAITALVEQLPQQFAATLFIAIHFPATSISLLPQILNRYGVLSAAHPSSNTQIQPGRIYVAPPNFHLLLRPGHLVLSQGPKENGHRPAIDTLFRSAANSYGRRVIGVILSGALDDGTAGLWTIKAQGGLTIVQDPEEALFDSMPRSAIANVEVDYVLKAAEIGTQLIQLTNMPREESQPMTDHHHRERDLVAQDKAALERGERPGNPSTLTCPDCGGVLWELRDGDMIRFRCHVGHAYSSDSLMAEQADDVERALWSAVRALEEKAALARRMAYQAREKNRLMSANQFFERAQEAEQHAKLVRQVMQHNKSDPTNDS